MAVDAVAGKDPGDDLPAVLVQVVGEEGEHIVLLVARDSIVLQDGQESVGDEGGVVGAILDLVDLAVRGLQVRTGLFKLAAQVGGGTVDGFIDRCINRRPGLTGRLLGRDADLLVLLLPLIRQNPADVGQLVLDGQHLRIRLLGRSGHRLGGLLLDGTHPLIGLGTGLGHHLVDIILGVVAGHLGPYAGDHAGNRTLGSPGQLLLLLADLVLQGFYLGRLLLHLGVHLLELSLLLRDGLILLRNLVFVRGEPLPPGLVGGVAPRHAGLLGHDVLPLAEVGAGEGDHAVVLVVVHVPDFVTVPVELAGLVAVLVPVVVHPDTTDVELVLDAVDDPLLDLVGLLAAVGHERHALLERRGLAGPALGHVPPVGLAVILPDLPVQRDEIRHVGVLPDAVVVRELRTDVRVGRVLVLPLVMLVAVSGLARTEVRARSALLGIQFCFGHIFRLLVMVVLFAGVQRAAGPRRDCKGRRP